jgi:hypothetical protein
MALAVGPHERNGRDRGAGEVIAGPIVLRDRQIIRQDHGIDHERMVNATPRGESASRAAFW